jgi:hypothetical protein
MVRDSHQFHGTWSFADSSTDWLRTLPAQVSVNIYYSYVGQINPKFQYSE